MDILLIMTAFMITAVLEVLAILNKGDKSELVKYIVFTVFAAASSLLLVVFVRPNSIANIIKQILKPVIKVE